MKKLYTIVILCLISMGNAAYLTNAALKFKAGTGSPLFCDVNSQLSCSSLFGFDFSRIFGIPFPMIALFVYPIIALIAILAIMGKIQNHFKIMSVVAIGGMMFNGYFIFHEYLVGVFCLGCLACSAAITTIAILSLIGLKDKKAISN